MTANRPAAPPDPVQLAPVESTPAPGLPAPLGRDYLADPRRVVGQLRESCPVAEVSMPGGGTAWLVTRDRDVRAGFREPRLSLQGHHPAPWPKGRRAIDVSLMNYDPPYHGNLRRLAAPHFAAARVATYRPRIEAIADDLLRASSRTGPLELMGEFARPFSHRTLCDLFAIHEPDRSDLYRWADTIFDRVGHPRSELEASANALDAYMTAEVARRRAVPGDDVLSAMVGGWDAAGGIRADELISLCAMVLLAGLDSTAQMIGMCVLTLLDHPDVIDRLRDDETLIPNAVDELLRWDTPGNFGTRRLALDDVAIGDVVIPADSGVLLCIASANRDPRTHPDPDRFDVDRPHVGHHIAFGLGPHYCLGAGLARLELTVALTALIRHLPRLQASEPGTAVPWQGSHYHRRIARLLVQG